MRLLAGAAALHFGTSELRGATLTRILPQIIQVFAGVLILLGLWTPVAGLLVAIVAIWNAVLSPGDPWALVLLAALGLGMAMVGPGAWSVDARLFGRKRIDLPGRD
jgi:uncharacterized membrane protein YphA (DoxX/SURF4 family)